MDGEGTESDQSDEERGVRQEAAGQIDRALEMENGVLSPPNQKTTGSIRISPDDSVSWPGGNGAHFIGRRSSFHFVI
jgi:hypothetical protein